MTERVLTDHDRYLVGLQIQADTVWCLRCGIHGLNVEAVTRYDVGDGITVPACRPCWNQAIADGINILTLTPVVQPSHLQLLHNLARPA